jgi:hypothetical protein
VRGVAAAGAFADVGTKSSVMNAPRPAPRSRRRRIASSARVARFDDDRLRHLAQQRVERGFEALRRAHGFRRGDAVRDQLHDGATDVFVLRFERASSVRSESTLYVVCEMVSRAEASDSRGFAARAELVASRDRIARGLLRDDQVLLGVAHGLLPLVHLRERAVAALAALRALSVSFVR